MRFEMTGTISRTASDARVNHREAEHPPPFGVARVCQPHVAYTLRTRALTKCLRSHTALFCTILALLCVTEE